MTRTTLVGAALAVLTLTSVLAGCGGTTDTNASGGTTDTNASSGTTDTNASSGNSATSAASGQPSDHNQADVTFAQQMISHHAQAVEMATVAPGHTSNAEVLDLAGRI